VRLLEQRLSNPPLPPQRITYGTLGVIRRACTLLRNEAIPIDAIPYQCGYASSPAYLKTLFKRQTGLTMREWRRKIRQSEN